MKQTQDIASLKTALTQIQDQERAVSLCAAYAKGITGAQRCSIFVYAEATDKLVSIYMDGLLGIKLKSNAGVVGFAFHKCRSIVENDTSSSAVFLKGVDKKSGYKTTSILASPIVNSLDKRLGVIEILNKQEGFDENDTMTLETIADLLVTIIDPDSTPKGTLHPAPQPLTSAQILQKKLDEYLLDKSLYLMEDGNAYYKIIGMGRGYYIGADICYNFTQEEKELELHYQDSQSDILLHVNAKGMVDENIDGILIAARETQWGFERYSLEVEKGSC